MRSEDSPTLNGLAPKRLSQLHALRDRKNGLPRSGRAAASLQHAVFMVVQHLHGCTSQGGRLEQVTELTRRQQSTREFTV